MRTTFRRISFPVSIVVLMLFAAAPSYGSLAVPVVTTPSDGATVDSLPVFAWNPVTGADHYDFQLSADSGFSSVLADITTKNSRATLTAPLQNGTYYWHVLAINAAGTAQSAWSVTRTINLNWSEVATPQSPTQGQSLAYPSPVLLNWTTVPYAQQYIVKLATDSGLSNEASGFPVTTSASAYSPTARLSPGTYYWNVTPLDASGHLGTPSPVYHFTWAWPTTSTLTVKDLDTSSQVFDPQFSWTPIPGAASYNIQINRAADFSGTPAFTATKIYGTSLTPLKFLPAATYYWRVQAVDSHGVAGVWNAGPGTFSTAYDSNPGAIPNLTMLDYTTGQSNWSQGYSTAAPVISWDPVAGASSYEVNVTLFTSGVCNWSQGGFNEWDDTTAATSWTPLGTGWDNVKPYQDSHNLGVATDSAALVPGDQYCVRVRALRNNDSTNHLVFGDWASLGDGTLQPSFTFAGYPTSPVCGGALCNTQGSDYYGPIQGASSTSVPLFTWNPIAGAQSYYVLVATDPGFQNVVDYAFTKEPAYAPRAGSLPTTYQDSTTAYYWVVLPAESGDGSLGSGFPADNAPQSFNVHSSGPSLITPDPVDGPQPGEPTFQWSPVDGAFYYEVDVNGPNGFTDSAQPEETSYTANVTYAPGDYTWTVHALDRNGTPMAPSSTGTFTVQALAVPTLPANPPSGDAIPVWQWNPMPGAIGYDVHVNLPDGTTRDFNGLDTTAFTATSMAGVGIFNWQVRAEYPTNSLSAPSAYSPLQTFIRTLHAPTGTTAVAAPHELALSWAPKDGAKQYFVQVSTAPTFGGNYVYQAYTNETAMAPDLGSNSMFASGGTLYWHVRAIDADGNTGAFSATQTFQLPTQITLSYNGLFQKGTRKTVTITAKDAYGHPLAGVSIRVSGAGVVTTTKKTASNGAAAFSLTAKSVGSVTATATKTGCVGASTKITVML